MRTAFSKRLSLLLASFAILFASGCADAVFSDEGQSPANAGEPAPVIRTEAPVDGDNPKLRHPQLLQAAQGSGAGKDGGDVNLYIAFNTYEADGITPRVLDKYGITNRILEEYGITRRILEDYGITNRVLEEYGITSRVLEEYGITNRVLEEYGITKRVLEEYGNEITDALLAANGITTRMLEDYGITTRVLEEYNITARVLEEYGITARVLEEFARDFQRSLRLKVRVDKAFPGISVRISSSLLESFLAEIANDPDIYFVEPDPSFTTGQIVIRNGLKKQGQALPWGIARVGASFSEMGDEDVHVFTLDSGVFDEDLNVVEQKDFTMLFVNRDQTTWDDSEYIEMPVFDPGEQGNPLDLTGHGTHVAGTIGAKNNDKGVKGMAPDVKIHSLKVLTDEGQTDITTVIAAIDYVTDWKQRNPLVPVVLNMSLGMDLGSTAYNVLDEAVDRAIGFGVTVVVSAGNDGRDASTYSPAHVTEAITVGAYDPNDLFADFSNYGPVVDLLAPGAQVVSLSHLEQDLDAGDNILLNGTSHAAPHVAAAAALYLSHNPQASPAEVKQALLNYAQPGILNVPEGTTDRTVYVKDFADDGETKAFAITKAEWHDGDSTDKLRVEGEGPRLDQVTIRSAATGAELAALTIEEDGKWKYEAIDPATVPCAVTVQYHGSEQEATKATADIEFAPSKCEQSFVFTKVEWKDKDRELKLEGKGPYGMEVAFTNAATGEAITTLTIGSDGQFSFDQKDLSMSPCQVRATFGAGMTVDEYVPNPPAVCGDVPEPLVIEKAEYDSNKDKLKIEGEGGSGFLTALAPTSGAVIGTTEAGGGFRIEVRAPATMPCTVRVEDDNGTVAEYPVTDRVTGEEPDDCEKSFVLEHAKWNDGHQELELKGTGLHNGTVTFANARTSEIFHTAQLDNRGRFDDKVGNPAAIPCEVIIVADEADDVVMQVPVENQAYNCDVNLVFSTLRWFGNTKTLNLGGTATAASDVTLVNPDNGAAITTITVGTNRTWQASLVLKESGNRPPCRVEARAANGDVTTNSVSASNCDPNFEYTPIEEEIEQNAHSFVTVTDADWSPDDRTLSVSGTGYVFYDVTLSNARMDTELGSTTVDGQESWTLTVQDPAVVPCAVRATLDGRMVDLAVDGITTCDEIPYILEASWDRGKLELEADGPYNATVSIESTTQGPLYSTTFDEDGQLDIKLDDKDIPFAPCTVRLDVNGQSHELEVDDAPVYCDNNAVVELEKAEWKGRGKLKLEGQGWPGSGATDVTVTFSNPATGATLGTATTDDKGEWQVELTKIKAAPCTVQAEIGGATSLLNVKNAPGNCR